MFDRFFPDEYVASTYIIPFEKLYEDGYRGVIFDIDNTLAGLPINVESFDLNYHDCTATITFNTSNNQVTSYTQVMNIDVTASIKVIGSVSGSGMVINTIELTNFVY